MNHKLETIYSKVHCILVVCPILWAFRYFWIWYNSLQNLENNWEFGKTQLHWFVTTTIIITIITIITLIVILSQPWLDGNWNNHHHHRHNRDCRKQSPSRWRGPSHWLMSREEMVTSMIRRPATDLIIIIMIMIRILIIIRMVMWWTSLPIYGNHISFHQFHLFSDVAFICKCAFPWLLLRVDSNIEIKS